MSAAAAPASGPTALVDALRARVESTLGPVLHGVRRVALLDVPVHENIGDSAIFLGTLAFLRRAGIPVCCACSIDTYTRAGVAQRLGDGMILLSGGGNLGDLWPYTEAFRHRVLADFPRTPIVQLPQTMYYANRAALDAARAAFDAHPRLTLMLRDAHSLEAARAAFAAPAVLCPDLAFALGPIRRPVAPTAPVVWLARRDREAAPGARPAGVATVDWTTRPRSRLAAGERQLRTWITGRPTMLGPATRALGVVAGWAAAQRVRAGCAMLAAGRAVITDRLHGHILSLLLGIPHAVLDNSYGKVRHFYETWTHGSPLVRWVESADRALDAVAEWTS